MCIRSMTTCPLRSGTGRKTQETAGFRESLVAPCGSRHYGVDAVRQRMRTAQPVNNGASRAMRRAWRAWLAIAPAISTADRRRVISSRPIAACVFCAIHADPARAAFVYDDEHVGAFLDHRPLFPGHVLVVPRE